MRQTAAPITTSREGHGFSPSPDLRPLLDSFLAHILDYRGYSAATADAYRRDCSRFIDFLEQSSHPLTPEAVTTRDVQLFVSDLSSRVGPSSVRRALYALSSFLKYLCYTEIISRNAASPVEPPRAGGPSPSSRPRTSASSSCRRARPPLNASPSAC